MVIFMTRVFHKRGNICSTSVNKIASKAMYKRNSGDTLSGTVSWSKLFSEGIFITSVGYLKLKFEFPKQLKKCHSGKIVCPVQVHTSFKTLLQVSTMGYDLFITCSLSHVDKTILHNI